MRSDALLAFVPIGSPLSLIGNGTTELSSVIDLLGQGVGTAPANIIGTASVFGTDMGIGAFRPELNAVIGTAVVGGTSVNAQFQAAVDQGAGGGYQPGTWITLAETGALAVANLIAGQVIARFPWLPAFPPGTLPRFLRLAFVNVGNITAGNIASALVVPGRDDQANRYAAKNYSVG